MDNLSSPPGYGGRSSTDMYQGLGETCLNVFLWLTAWSFIAAAVTVLIVRVVKRFAIGWGVAATIMLGIVFAYGSNSILHREKFVQQHQNHNTLVPATRCVRYEPSFGHLFAVYEMTAADFDALVSQHPWGLVEYDRALIEHDEQRLGFSEPSQAYATEMASNGGQLRVYFKDGIMYLSYNVM